jgi:hypothetical protein
MSIYIRQFRPLKKEDVETIRKQQDNTRNIAVMLEKKPVFSENKTLNFEVRIMPELNESVEDYYIMKNNFEIKDNLPFIMTQEVYDAHVIRELEIKNRPTYLTPIFEEWVDDNFNISLFGRYELKDDPDGNKGNWTMDKLYEKWSKHEYGYYMSKKGNPVLVLNPSIKKEFSNNNFKKEPFNGIFSANNLKSKEERLLNNIAYSLCDSFVIINTIQDNVFYISNTQHYILAELYFTLLEKQSEDPKHKERVEKISIALKNMKKRIDNNNEIINGNGKH